MSVQRSQCDTAILQPPIFGVVAGDGLSFAVTARGHGVADTAGLQVLENALGAARRKLQVVGIGAATVGMPRDFDVELGITFERRDGTIEHRNALGQQLGAVRFELHTLEQQLLVERAAGGIDALALGRTRALVFAVDDAVAVAVELTTLFIDLGARRRVWALVAGVAHAITVAVELAAGGVDLGAGRSSGALVDVIGYAVAIVI